VKVLVVDDHAVVRDGLRRLLVTLPNVEIFDAATGREALSFVQRQMPELILLDLHLPGIGGIELLRRLLVVSPTVHLLVFSMHAESMYAARALQAGARGYVSKNASPEELQVALRRVIDGGRYVEREIAQELAVLGSVDADPWNRLTERDLEILRLLS
jgi:two-component system invasion response regulator UvrY